MSATRFAEQIRLLLLRFAGGQVATVVRSLGLHVRKAFSKPMPVVFDRTPKKGG